MDVNGIEIAGSFKMLLRQLEEPPKRICRTTLKYGNFIITVEGDHMAYTLPVDQQVEVQVAYVDSKGNPAQVDGSPEWSSSDPSLLTVTADPDDPFKALIVPVGGVGNVQVKVDADADLGSGVTSLVTLMDVTLVAGEAVAGTITPVGSPEPIP